MKKKLKRVKFNPVAKARATGEHGAMRSIMIHREKTKYTRKHKHKNNQNEND